MTLNLPVSDEANELLSRSPLALLLAMMLDQQVPLEKAFSSPYELARRLGHEPTAAELAEFDPDALVAIFSERPALHRFPRAMAGRAQELARQLVDQYDGDAAGVWTGVETGQELIARLSKLAGFGGYKAQITTGANPSVARAPGAASNSPTSACSLTRRLHFAWSFTTAVNRG